MVVLAPVISVLIVMLHHEHQAYIIIGSTSLSDLSYVTNVNSMCRNSKISHNSIMIVYGAGGLGEISSLYVY